MVLPNLYGSIIQNICHGITGGVGMCNGATVGKDYVMFTQGHRHNGRDIQGLDIANPTGMLFSSVNMLRHMGLFKFADKVEFAVTKTIDEGKVRTPDMGGNARASEYKNEIIRNLRVAE